MVRYSMHDQESCDIATLGAEKSRLVDIRRYSSRNRTRVVVWDLPVRLFHWSLVAAIAVLYFTARAGGLAMEYHKITGYGVLGLVLFRILWGFFGSTHARFSNFCYAPKTIMGYAGTLFTRAKSKYLGHNPLGGISAVVLLVLVLIQAVTGLFANDEVILEGPLAHYLPRQVSERITSFHKTSFYVLLGAIGLHVSAILFYLLFKKENLIAAMVTGKKELEHIPEKSTVIKPWWLAVAFGGLSSIAIYWLVNR